MQLKKDAWFIVKAILVILALLIIGKFFIWDEFIKPKEKEEVPEPVLIQKNVIDRVMGENDGQPIPEGNE